MEPSENSKRKASEMTPDWWWPEKAELEPVPDFMSSNALFFVLWEALGTEASISFKFRTDPDAPSLSASVFMASKYHFYLEKGEDAAYELTKNDTLDEKEAQQRLLHLVENGNVRSVVLAHSESDYTRESTRREEGGWTAFKLKDE